MGDVTIAQDQVTKAYRGMIVLFNPVMLSELHGLVMEDKIHFGLEHILQIIDSLDELTPEQRN